MLRDSAGWLMCRAAAARTKLPCSARATTWRNCWSSRAMLSGYTAYAKYALDTWPCRPHRTRRVGRTQRNGAVRAASSFTQRGDTHENWIVSSGRRRAGRRTHGARQPRAGRGPQAEHSRHLGRRHRRLQHQRLQPRHDGLQDAQHRQHRQRGRDVHRLVRPAELHRRPRRVHHRPVADPHRPHQGRPARRARGHAQGRPDDRHAAPRAGLRHRPVRQEPPRRPRRHAADGARLRRVLRQPLPPQRRGRAGEPRLSEEPRVPGRNSVRAA